MSNAECNCTIYIYLKFRILRFFKNLRPIFLDIYGNIHVKVKPDDINLGKLALDNRVRGRGLVRDGGRGLFREGGKGLVRSGGKGFSGMGVGVWSGRGVYGFGWGGGKSLVRDGDRGLVRGGGRDLVRGGGRVRGCVRIKIRRTVGLGFGESIMVPHYNNPLHC